MKIRDIVGRLGLRGCKDTKLGGILMKGISGGERKRTSIGYEQITDPKLLLCDEPTSGLDSSTALRIVEMLKKEAVEQNLTVICTIHQPSAEIFQTFDRLLLLQEGYQIYQGPIAEIPSYLSDHLGCKLRKYQNPSDYIIKLAQMPSRCNPDLDLPIMVATYDRVIRPVIEQGMVLRTTRYSNIDTRFEEFAEKRSASFWV